MTSTNISQESPSKKRDIDIVIVNFRSTDSTVQCLHSLLGKLNGLDANVIVVDNHSDDDPDRLTVEFPEIELIKNERNIGFGRAINQALSHYSSPLCLLLNPDTVIHDGFFKEIKNFMNNNTTVGILGPRIYEHDGSIQGSARRYPTPLTSIFGRRSPLTKLFPNNQFTKKEFLCFNSNGDKPFDVDWVSGACMVVRKKAIDAVNGFDERFFLYWEDTDLCKRIRDKGWKVLYFPSAEITHVVGQSSSQSPLLATYHFHRSCYYLFLKHGRMPVKLITPFVFFGLSMRALVIMLIHLIRRL